MEADGLQVEVLHKLLLNNRDWSCIKSIKGKEKRKLK